MSKTFVVVGCKVGDILAGLPIIYHFFVTAKIKPKVVVSKDYAAIFDRVSYADVICFDGEWTDLQGALKFAKQNFNNVLCLTGFGRDFPIEHRTSSFVLELYERAGVLNQWGTLPLVISHGDQGRFDKPTILFADHSQSSPFLGKQELYGLLVESFPDYQVLRLSDYKLEHFADFVSWYESAKAIVTIECAHLHLSAATTTPVFALATDRPARWNGSAWSKRFAFYCRYGEFEDRKEELIEAIRDTLEGIKKPEVKVLNGN